MKTFGESIKKAFKDSICKWWFLFGVFTSSIVGVLCSIAGIILMILGGDAYSGINYGWATDLLTSLASHPVASELGILSVWFFERAVLFFVAFFLAFMFFGILPTRPNRDKHFEKVLKYTGMVFFTVNLIAMVILIFIIHLTREIRNPPYLGIIQNLIGPFSLSGFIFIGALANINKDGFNWKIAARIIVLKYLFLVINIIIFRIVLTSFPEGSSTVIHVDRFLSFIIFSFSVFIYAAVLDGETILESIAKGISFFLRNFLYALLLSLIVFLTKPYILTSYAWRLIRSGFIMSILDMQIFRILNPFLEIMVFVIAATFYRMKLKKSLNIASEN